MKHTTTPWWQTDQYDWDVAMPTEFEQVAGPKGPALVRAWPDGRTDQGWGLNAPAADPSAPGFYPRYVRGEFNSRRILFGFEKGKWAFAFIMRSVRLVCIDIDGKNGGLDGAKKLGALPYTLAETSKSGTGYHLFYLVDDEWVHDVGFGLLNDRIGLEQGVDVRATGCVYHYKQQRWNHRKLAKLPQHLLDTLRHKQQQHAAASSRITAVLENNDETEVLLMRDQLQQDLMQPIPAGKRNNTLFAIGTQMKEAQISDWDAQVHARALAVGLDQDEADKLVANIDRYAAAPTP